MKRPAICLLSLLIAIGFTGCEAMSTDPAPGGITATEIGMNSASVREWQDRTIRQLAY